MSDNYKVIRLIKESAQTLMNKGWTHSGVVKEIGISHNLLKEILEFDEVSVNVREPTVVKMKEFLKRSDMIIAGKSTKPPKKEPKPEKEEFPINVPESMTEAIPDETAIKRDPAGTENLLAELVSLADRFAKQGFRLDAQFTLQHTP